MFKIKRPAIIGLLVVLLVFTGYLNHQLTQQSQRKSSKDYKNYEMDQMAKYKEEKNDNKEKNLVKDKNEDAKKTAKKTKLHDKDKIVTVDSIKKVDKETLETMYTESSMNSKNYFVEYRLSRDKLRASLVDRLDEMVNNENTNKTMMDEAQKEIIKLGNISEKELQMEGLIKGKGYEDALVFLTEEDVKVVVSIDELNEQDMVKILEIVHSETNYETSNIKIMKKQ